MLHKNAIETLPPFPLKELIFYRKKKNWSGGKAYLLYSVWFVFLIPKSDQQTRKKLKKITKLLVFHNVTANLVPAFPEKNIVFFFLENFISGAEHSSTGIFLKPSYPVVHKLFIVQINMLVRF